MSFALAPSYSREASFGIGGILTGLYRLDRTDSIMPPPQTSPSPPIYPSGVFTVSARQETTTSKETVPGSITNSFFNEPLSLWGIRYRTTSVNPSTHYTRQDVRVNTQYIHRMTGNFYIGGIFDLTYKHIRKIDDVSYLDGQSLSYLNTGIGFSLQYDTRDFIPNPGQGMYLLFQEVVYPQATDNYHRTLFRTTVIADLYRKVWTGGLIALDLYGRFNPKDAPWTLREELGGSRRMRGYYSGRYMDSNIMSGQIELRQHLWKRLGCVFFAGGGTVAPLPPGVPYLPSATLVWYRDPLGIQE
ncbi:MAG: outer membrane protein assembly factor [Bacteroides sp.]|nr:outer membrane protein assembly factor [Bacteroides sp.]